MANDKNDNEESHLHKKSREPGLDGFWAGSVAAIVIATGVYFAGRSIKEDSRETQNQVIRSVLKDPAVIEGLIRQIKETPETQELLADPEIMKNLRKLTDAARASLEQKEALNDTNPANWAGKAIQGKGGQSPKRD